MTPTPEFAKIELPDGGSGRQVSFSFRPRIDEDLLEEGLDDVRSEIPASIGSRIADSSDGRLDESVTIVVAASTAEIEALVARLFWLLLAVAIVSVTISLGLIFAVVWSSLIPLRRIAEKIEAIDEESLDNCLDPGPVPEELRPIVKRLDDLLHRIGSVMPRERAFSSEVSHELRTPLAGIRSTIEVCLNRPRDSEEYREALQTCQRICCQSQQMVESLMAISRIEAGDCRQVLITVDLAALIQDCLEDFVAHAELKNATVEASALEPISVEADVDKLRVVFRNLLQNAVNYCDDHGTIRIWSQCTNGSVQISIENTGNKVATADLPLVCERFWRGDAARTGTGEHFGLGLSLVKKLLTVMNGRLDITVSGPEFRTDRQSTGSSNGARDRERSM